MLDANLATFYGVTTFNLNNAVSHNAERFPDDFSFLLTLEETRALMFQIETSKPTGRGGVRTPALVFTAQGVAMLAGVCHSQRAFEMSVAIVRAVVQLRQLLATDGPTHRRRIGLHQPAPCIAKTRRSPTAERS